MFKNSLILVKYIDKRHKIKSEGLFENYPIMIIEGFNREKNIRFHHHNKLLIMTQSRTISV